MEFGYYVILSAATNVDDFKRRITKEVQALGFSEYSFMRLEHFECHKEVMKLNTISPDLTRSYYSSGYYKYDLALHYARLNKKPVFRTAINEYVKQSPFETNETRCIDDVIELNRRYGYYEYFNVPMEARNGNGHVVFTVAHRGLMPLELKKKVNACYSDLTLLCDAIDYVQTLKFSDYFIGNSASSENMIKINPKPLRVLDVLANNDFTIGQVADQLCISEVTAGKHLETARKAFQTRTNQAAIKKAIQCGLIKYTKQS